MGTNGITVVSGRRRAELWFPLYRSLSFNVADDPVSYVWQTQPASGSVLEPPKGPAAHSPRRAFFKSYGQSEFVRSAVDAQLLLLKCSC